ncbi:MAG: CRTAC1 family protein [Candidatus Latescibacteria bacterium]|nr:CRTAC1 family protein [Candidatus Latescibacterota bacterium]
MNRVFFWLFLIMILWGGALWADSPRFVDVTASSGIDFRHIHGGTGRKYFVETMGSGVAFLDYNNDGRLDVFAVNGGTLPGYAGPPPRNRLYRNAGEGRFSDVTRFAGVGETAYGMGVCAGDFDNDGHDDLYVTCYGPNSLFRNNGDGTFRNIATEAGVAGDATWSVGCAFLDYDADGFLDLYVANYVDYSIASPETGLRPYVSRSARPSEEGRFYPHPDNFKGAADRLYRNIGKGTFADVTKPAGVFDPGGKGMGMACTDVNGDGAVDVFVANDMTPNFLYLNQGDGRFVEKGLLSGAAYSGSGELQSSMGADFGDFNRDGRLDLAVTNFRLEGAGLYRNEGGALFTDISSISGVRTPTIPHVGWGMGFLDYDNDGWTDLLMVHGHVLDNADRVGSVYPQPAILMRNRGDGRFVDVTREVTDDLSTPVPGRGAAFGDYDNDGDVDVFVLTVNGAARLLRNEVGNRNRWLRIKLVGAAREHPERSRDAVRRSNRNGIGARVTVWTGGREQTREVRSGSSYLSQNDLRLHFGLGNYEAADSVRVRWPGGAVDRLGRLSADREIVVREGESGP